MIIYTLKKIKRCYATYHYTDIDYYNAKVGSNMCVGSFSFKNINRAYKALEKFNKKRTCDCECEIKEK